jgi:hypothetical protein
MQNFKNIPVHTKEPCHERGAFWDDGASQGEGPRGVELQTQHCWPTFLEPALRPTIRAQSPYCLGDTQAINGFPVEQVLGIPMESHK